MKKIGLIVCFLMVLSACDAKQNEAQNGASAGVYKSKGGRGAPVACLDKKILIDIKNELGKGDKLDNMRLMGLMEMGACVPVVGNINVIKTENTSVSGNKYNFAVIEIPDSPSDEPRYVLLDMIEKSQ